MTLTELERRLVEATGADNALDEAIAETVGGYKRDCPVPGCTSLHSVPSYTSSLDAAVALTERVLPGWGYFLRRDNDGCTAGLVYPKYDRVTPGAVTAKTMPLAVVLATIRSLIKQENGE